MSGVVGNLEDSFSHDTGHMVESMLKKVDQIVIEVSSNISENLLK